MRSKKEVEYIISDKYDRDRVEEIKSIDYPPRVREDILSRPKYPFKEEITELLTDINPKKLSKAKKLFKKFDCMRLVKDGILLEQIYRGFYRSFKIKYSHSNFKKAALVMLYIYNYLDEDEVDVLLKNPGCYNTREEIYSKHSSDMKCIKEVEDVLSRNIFYGHIGMHASALCIGASVSFTLAVKSMLDVLTRLHRDKDYRKSMEKNLRVGWDEGMLFRAMPHRFYKKMEIRNVYPLGIVGRPSSFCNLLDEGGIYVCRVSCEKNEDNVDAGLTEGVHYDENGYPNIIVKNKWITFNVMKKALKLLEKDPRNRCEYTLIKKNWFEQPARD